MTGNPRELFRKFFGVVRAIFWLWGSFWAPEYVPAFSALIKEIDAFPLN